MKRAALYARFSTDLQNERSIDDQIALCRAYAAREGYEIAVVYEDRARSGGSLFGRDGAAALMRDAAARRFDAVIVEALDRLSRDMEDLAGIYKRLSFAEIELRAVHDGAVDDMMIGFRGLFGQFFRKDLKDKIRRGMAGRVRDGLVQDGLAYGYAAVPGKSGERVIIEAEAAIVRRIFREYVDGAPAREIARNLNADGIPAPRGGKWNGTTINGNGKRGVGILRNELYAGRFVWGRTRKITAPDTGRDIIRLGAADARVTAELPALAIVPRDLFDRAAARKRAMATAQPAHHRRHKYLLSGLMRCASCGGGLYVQTTSRSGNKRVECSRQRESKDCPAPRSFTLTVIEDAVLGGLKRELRRPTALPEFVRTYREEWDRLTSTSSTRRKDLEREAEQTQRRLDRIVACIVDGHGDPAVLGPQSTALHRQLQTIRVELAALDERPTIVALHSAGLSMYGDYVDEIAQHLSCGGDVRQIAAADAIRSLIQSVTVRPGDALNTVRVTIKGRLSILAGDGARALRERVDQVSQSPDLPEACFIIEAAA